MVAQLHFQYTAEIIFPELSVPVNQFRPNPHGNYKDTAIIISGAKEKQK